MNVPKQLRNSSIFDTGLCSAHFSCSQEASLHSELKMTQQIVLMSGKIFFAYKYIQNTARYFINAKKPSPASNYYLWQSALTEIPTSFNLPQETCEECRHRIPGSFISRIDFRENWGIPKVLTLCADFCSPHHWQHFQERNLFQTLEAGWDCWCLDP